MDPRQEVVLPRSTDLRMPNIGGVTGKSVTEQRRGNSSASFATRSA